MKDIDIFKNRNRTLRIEKMNLIKAIERKETLINDLLKRISDLEFEVERLNNVINELEKWLKYEINKSGFEQDYEIKSCYEDIFEELQELKGSDKE